MDLKHPIPTSKIEAAYKRIADKTLDRMNQAFELGTNYDAPMYYYEWNEKGLMALCVPHQPLHFMETYEELHLLLGLMWFAHIKTKDPG